MDKLLEFDGYDRYGPHVFPVDIGYGGGQNHHIKLATDIHPAIAKYLASATRIPDKTQLLIDALGAGEWWGSNRNGDYFPQDQLYHPGKDYGYETFQHYAFPYKHHINKDPNKAYGDRVILSVYHPDMHRVQLIVAVHDSKCRDILSQVDNGEYPDVSMGCRVPYDQCFPAKTLVYTGRGYLNIEDVEVGDLVVTHTGKRQRVTRIIGRTTDSLISICSPAFPTPVRQTLSHEYYGIRRESLRSCNGSAGGIKRRHSIVNGQCVTCHRQVNLTPEWIPAEDLRVGDYIVHPIRKSEEEISVSDAFARVCGYYLGDGCRIQQRRGRERDGEYRLQGLAFSCHKDEKSHINKLVNTLSELGQVEPKIYDESYGRNACSIRVYGNDLAERVVSACGFNKEKHLPYNCWSWTKSERFNLLAGLIDTDGSQDHNKKNGSIRFCNTNRCMAEETRDLCLTLGIPASINKQNAETSFGHSEVFHVHIPASYSSLISPYSEKVKECNASSGSKIVITEDYALYPVTSISTEILDSPEDVFNLSVDGDESYTVHSAAVHNCSVCGNRAKNRSQYCMDLKNRMNRILPDGRKVMAINWRPKFFDISFVLIGAEKASHVLMKVANMQNAAPRLSAELGDEFYNKRMWKGADFKSAAVKKQGTITKKVPMNVDSIEPVLEHAPDIKNHEPELPSAVVHQLAGFPLKEIFSTLAFLGIDPKPEEFQRIVLTKSGKGGLAEKYASERKVFDETTGTIPESAERIIPIEPDYISEKIAHILAPYLAERSCFNDFLVARLETYANDENPWYPSTRSTVLAGIPIAASTAGLYKYIKSKSPKASMTMFDKAVSRHPWLLGLLVAAGAGTIASGINLLRPMPFDKNGSLDAEFGTGYNHKKQASSKKWLLPLALAPLAYMYSGVQRSRAMQGERLGRFDSFLAERPDVAAIASVLAAPTALAKGKKLSAGLRQLMKTGSVYSDFGLFALASKSKILPAALAGALIDAAVFDQIGKIVSKRSGKK